MKETSGWTLDTLGQYLIAKIENLEKLFLLEARTAKEAITKAEMANEKRFESVNEFRATLSDQAASFMTRREYQANHEALEQKVEGIDKRLSAVEGKEIGIDFNVNRTSMIVFGLFTFVSTTAAVTTIILNILKP